VTKRWSGEQTADRSRTNLDACDGFDSCLFQNEVFVRVERGRWCEYDVQKERSPDRKRIIRIDCSRHLENFKSDSEIQGYHCADRDTLWDRPEPGVKISKNRISKMTCAYLMQALKWSILSHRYPGKELSGISRCQIKNRELVPARQIWAQRNSWSRIKTSELQLEQTISMKFFSAMLAK